MQIDPVVACVLAFDYGSSRIGVAICRPNQAHAEPLTTVDASAEVWPQIYHLVGQHHPDILVVGWPRNLEADKTVQTRLAEEFADTLRSRTRLPVILQDEVLSSAEADMRIDTKLPLKKQKELRDQIAAQVILEDYVQRQTHKKA